jgi:hypothetical protein
MDDPRMPYTPQAPHPPDPIEAVLREEIRRLQAERQNSDPLRPADDSVLEDASVEALGRHETGMSGSWSCTPSSACAAAASNPGKPCSEPVEATGT